MGLTRLPGGLRLFVNCPVVWEKCLLIKVSLLILVLSLPVSTSVLERFKLLVAQTVRAVSVSSVLSVPLVVISQIQSQVPPLVLCRSSGVSIRSSPRENISLPSTLLSVTASTQQSSTSSTRRTSPNSQDSVTVSSNFSPTPRNWTKLCNWSESPRSLTQTEWMMKAMMGFHDEAQKAIAQGGNWNKVREATGEIQSQLRSMKFEVPGDGEDVIVKKYEDLIQAMTDKFASVTDE